MLNLADSGSCGSSDEQIRLGRCPRGSAVADRSRTPARKPAGFTLIELLVVIAIIALLVSILLPSLRRARDLAENAICLTTLRSHGLQIELYVSSNEGTYPVNPDRSDGSPNHDSQFRYFWQAMEGYCDEGAPDDTYGGVNLNYVCPTFRKRWASGGFNGWHWSFSPHLTGYVCNFGNLAGANNSDAHSSPAWKYRSFGGIRRDLPGSRVGSPVSQVGAIPATPPNRLMMLYDYGFCWNSYLPDWGSPGQYTHRNGWGALLADGHAALFRTANTTGEWYESPIVSSDVVE